MSEPKQFDASLSAPKHWIAVAAILACGMVAGALILRTPGTPTPAAASGHADADAHQDGEHHGQPAEKHGDHQEAGKHSDEEHHDAKTDTADKEKTASAANPHGEDAHGPEEEEGLVPLSEAQSKKAGVTLAQAGAAAIRKEVLLPGEIRLDEDRTAHVVPRVAGIVASVHARLGEQVAKGQLLAVIHSATVSDQRSELQTAQKRLVLAQNTFQREKQLWEEKISAEQDYLQARQALQEAEIAVTNTSQKLAAMGAGSGGSGGSSRYELRAPLAGVVVEKHLTVGESVTESTASFTVSNLSAVWAEINVAAPQLPYVSVGAPVTVRATAFESAAEGKIAYVGALIGEQTRTAPARVALANPQGVWRPGLFVEVKVLADAAQVPVAVDAKAIQRPNGKDNVVFVPAQGGYKAQRVQLGRSDGKTTEVTAGLQAGQDYVKDGSFLLKAELGKASAEHTH